MITFSWQIKLILMLKNMNKRQPFIPEWLFVQDSNVLFKVAYWPKNRVCINLFIDKVGGFYSQLRESYSFWSTRTLKSLKILFPLKNIILLNYKLCVIRKRKTYVEKKRLTLKKKLTNDKIWRNKHEHLKRISKTIECLHINTTHEFAWKKKSFGASHIRKRKILETFLNVLFQPELTCQGANLSLFLLHYSIT